MNPPGTLIPGPALTAFIEDVAAEARGAQQKFPGNADKVAATAEEMGELSKALLQHKYGKGPARDVYTEAVQLAAMAAQVALGGSEEFPYAFDMAFHDAFRPTGAEATGEAWTVSEVCDDCLTAEADGSRCPTCGRTRA